MDSRETYWNRDCRDYWKRRVAESGGQESNDVPGHSTTEEVAFYEEVPDFWRPKFGSVLDVGCAWGRMFPLLLGRGLRVSGVHISREMLSEAESSWTGTSGIVALRHAVAEKLPFDDATCDNLFFFATFDATDQKAALGEMIRVIRPGGQIHLTGKNTRYWHDDKRAKEAEVKARQKGHPNFFTDSWKLSRKLTSLGHRLIGQKFFEYRGHFSGRGFTTSWPGKFYEYLFVIQRRENYAKFAPFSSEVSETYTESASR